MARLTEIFDPSKITDERAAIPAGNYAAQVIESSLEITKSGTGSYIKLIWQLLGGEHSGRTIIQQITYENPNMQAVEIGQRMLKRLCDALGTGPVRDTQDLHMKPCTIVVKVRPARTDPASGKDYAEGNEISGFKAIDGVRPVAGLTTPVSEAQAAPAAPRIVTSGGNRPWAK